MGDVNALILARSPLSAVTYYHTKYGRYSIYFKIYFQDPEGRIRVSDGNGSTSVAVEAANLNNRFAALGWGGPEQYQQREERLYYTDNEGRIFEKAWIYDKGWHSGTLNGQFKAATYSSLAATVQYDNTGNWHFRVFYQDPDTDEIAELYKGGGNDWAQTSKHPAGVKGTSIAAYTSSTATRIWYQEPSLKFIQWNLEGGWTKGDFATTLEYDPGASITVPNDTSAYTVNRNNKLAVTNYTKETGWKPSELVTGVIPEADAAATAHQAQYDNEFVRTVFTQATPSQLTRVQFRPDGTWEENIIELKNS